MEDRTLLAGIFNAFPLPATFVAGALRPIGLRSITTGPDGYLWFTERLTENRGGAIGRISLAGTITGRVAPGDRSPGAPTDPDVPN